jgi:riboflavin synthase
MITEKAMFTGIIETTCAVVAVADHPGGRRLTVDLADLAGEPLALGESIAVDGVCLTVAAIDGPRAAFDAIAETLGLTTLGRLGRGSRVNVERALRPTDRLGGHFVQGHVDGMATLARHEQSAREVKLWFDAGLDLLAEMAPKGSVAVSGVSLTLVDVDPATGRFSVALIPTTLALTTLADLREGEPVNVETDILGKYVRRYLLDAAGGSAGELTWDKLRDAGFA